MMPEIGNGLLCLALGIALLLSVYPLWGVARGDARMMASSRLFAWLLFMSVAGAFLVLVNAFVVNDFTVTYVASNSNTQLPVWYRVAATWGAHEGSLLLWVLLMSGWTFAVAIFSQRIPLDIVARVLAIMGMVSVGFLLFILFTSNPFSRTLPNFPIEGRDLNLRDALLEVTRKNLGMTVICDDNMMIEGIFTDGDLRRVFDMGVDVRQLSIADVMTPGGIRVRPGILAVEALNLMQSRHITSVMVADGDQLLGVLHMHDLLRAGVV